MKLCIFFIAALSMALALSAADNGMVAAGRGTPVIDGRLDDSAWQNSIAMTPFLLQKQNRFATEQTTLRLLWDDTKLYAGFHCRERALEPVENKLHAFKRAFQGRDDDTIYGDDLVELLLWNPATPELVYDLAINANGAVCDSTGNVSASDLWSSRDRAWDAHAEVGVALENTDRNGFWSVEIAIPWSALGGAPRQTPWKMLAARFEKNAGEASAFQRVPAAGIHRFDYFGECRFVKAVPGVDLKTVPAFTPGENHLSTSLNNGDFRMPLALETIVSFGGAPARSRNLFSAKPQPDAGVVFQLQRSGAFTFRWSVSSSADFQPLFRSPEYQLQVSSSMLTASLADASLQLNGTIVQDRAMLVSGSNDLIVTAGKTPKLALAVGDYAINFPDGWRKTQDQYRLTLLVSDSVIWPNWPAAGGVAINRGAVQQVLFRPQGVRDMTLDDYTMYFDLPSGFTSPGASGYYNLYPIDFRRIGPIVHAGATFTRYAVTVRKPLKFNPNLQSHEYIAFLIAAPENYTENTTLFYYHAASEKWGVRELPNPVKISVLPKLDGKRPGHARIQLWTGWLASLDNKKLYESCLRMFHDAGINEISRMDHAGELNLFAQIGFDDWNFSLKPYLAQHPETARCDFNGQRSDRYVCASEMVENPEFAAFFRKQLPSWHTRWNSSELVVWDYEYRVLESYLACFCPKCLTEFARCYHITDPLTPGIIKDRYFVQWTEFMNRRMSEVAKLMSDAIHAELPGVSFAVYTGYQSEETKHFYGVDWSLLDGKIDLAMMGYGRNPNALAASRRALPRTPMLLGEIVTPYQITEQSAPTCATAAQLLRRACDATAGFLLYSYSSLDGRTFSAIAEVSRIMADHEAFFTSGIRRPEKLKISGFDQADYEVLGDNNGNFLIALMNPSRTPRQFQFDFEVPAGKSLRDVRTSSILRGPISGTIEPSGIAVYVVQ